MVVVVAHLFNCSIWDIEAGEFVASLVHVGSSRPARVTRETLPKIKPGSLSDWCVACAHAHGG